MTPTIRSSLPMTRVTRMTDRPANRLDAIKTSAGAFRARRFRLSPRKSESLVFLQRDSHPDRPILTAVVSPTAICQTGTAPQTNSVFNAETWSQGNDRATSFSSPIPMFLASCEYLSGVLAANFFFRPSLLRLIHLHSYLKVKGRQIVLLVTRSKFASEIIASQSSARENRYNPHALGSPDQSESAGCVRGALINNCPDPGSVHAHVVLIDRRHYWCSWMISR